MCMCCPALRSSTRTSQQKATVVTAVDVWIMNIQQLYLHINEALGTVASLTRPRVSAHGSARPRLVRVRPLATTAKPRSERVQSTATLLKRGLNN